VQLQDADGARPLSLSAGLIDTAAELDLERHTWLTAKALRAPLALISLVDERGHCRKSCLGPHESRSVACHVPLFDSLCSAVVSSTAPVVVEDARQHWAASHHPEVGSSGPLAYAGVPLLSVDGLTLGALAVIDTKPRQWSEDDVRMLRELASTVMTEIELRAAAGALHGLEDRWSDSAALAGDGHSRQPRISCIVEALRASAVTDELTGLHNRRAFIALAEHQIKLAARTFSPLLVFFADLDGLKRINDGFGHAAGDQSLRDTARLLRGTFRDSDVLARFGGDEFVVLACNATMADADRFATRLQHALHGHNATLPEGLQLALSTGATGYDPRRPEPLDTLLTRADAAMYVHKRSRDGRSLPAPSE
jgi:diguanylate cyclase (GGDEF)-like protein